MWRLELTYAVENRFLKFVSSINKSRSIAMQYFYGLYTLVVVASTILREPVHLLMTVLRIVAKYLRSASYIFVFSSKGAGVVSTKFINSYPHENGFNPTCMTTFEFLVFSIILPYFVLSL